MDSTLGNPIDIPVTPNGRGDVPIVSSGVLNAASFISETPVAPGGLVTVFGSKLAPDSIGLTGQQPFPSELGGTQVLLGGAVLPLLYASDTQINAQAPFDLPLMFQRNLWRDGALRFRYRRWFRLRQLNLPFSRKIRVDNGQGAIVNGITNQLADKSAPVTAGDTVAIYCTGLGAVNPPVPAGTPATGPVSTVQTVAVQIGEQIPSVIYSGLAPGFAGLYQVNAVVPAGVAAGSQVPVVLTTGGLSSPPVTIAVR
jgi:adhesin/invasin